MIQKACYGRLEYVLDFETSHPSGSSVMPHPVTTRRHLLAVITGCKTPGNADATNYGELVTYQEMDASSHVIDLNAVVCSVGRFHIGGAYPRWAIIDRSDSMARPVFVDQDEDALDMYDA